MTTTPRHPAPLRRYLRHGMLPQLATFEAVLRLRSATRAAEAMCIAQPTLSGHLRKLSEALGVALFTIRGKHFVPTEAALMLLRTSNEIFAALERCEAALADCRGDGPAISTNTAASPMIVIALPCGEVAVQAVADGESRATTPTPECQHGDQQCRPGDPRAAAHEQRDQAALSHACEAAGGYFDLDSAWAPAGRPSPACGTTTGV
jgi:hypothetical protein